MLRNFKRFDTVSTAKGMVEQTSSSISRQAERQSVNETTDRETGKVISTTTRVATPVGTGVGSAIYSGASAYNLQQYKELVKNTEHLQTPRALQEYFNKQNVILEESKNPNITFNTDGGLSTTVKITNCENLPESFQKKGVIITKNANDSFSFIDLKVDAGELNRIYATCLKEQQKQVELLTVEFDQARVAFENGIITKDIYDLKLQALSDAKKELPLLQKGTEITERLKNTAGKSAKFSNPKTWGRQMFRLASSPLQGADVMQGMNILEAGMGGAMAIGRFTGNISSAAGFKMYKTFKIQKEATVLIKSGVKTDLAFNQATEAFSKTWGTTKVRPWGKDSASRLLRRKLSEDTNKFAIKSLTKFIDSHKNSSIAKGALDILELRGQLLKDHVLTKNEINTVLRKKVTGKLKNKLIGTKLGSSVKKVTGKFAEKTAIKTMQTVFQKFAEGVAKIFATVAKILMFAVVFLLLASLIITVLDLFIQTLYNYNYKASNFFLGNVINENQANQSFISEDIESEWSSQLQDRGEKIMVTLNTSHNDMLDEIAEIRKQYDTTDTQYPSGSLENYKEIFCAVEVMCDFDFDTVTDAELQSWVDKLYDQTHIVTTEPYDFYYADGSVGHACHIYVDIQYDEMLAYEAMAGVTTGSSGGQVNIDATNCPKGTVVNSDWMNVVRTIKTLIAQTQATYNQTTYLPINVNGTVYQVRTDCSGFVSACLWLNGAAASGTNFNSQSLLNAPSISGFTKYSWNGWNVLQEGDIITYGSYKYDDEGNYGWSGHTEIFAYNANGKHYVYSNGSTNSLRSAVPTVAGNHSYNALNTVVWRPNIPGSTSTNLDVEGAVEIDAIVDEFDPFKPFYDSNNIILLFSNTADVIFNEETKNEDGFETAINVTVNAEMAETSFFTTGHFDTTSNVKNHTLDENEISSYDKISSYDFIRYVLAKHGVKTPSVYSELAHMYNEEAPSIFTFKVGDIAFYVPDSTNVQSNLVVPDFEPKDYEVGSVGYKIIETELVPMLCIGDNKFVAYSRNLNLSGSDYDNSTGSIRKYDLDNLDANNIVGTVRPNGYVIDSVYGQSGVFSGWTDTNIKAFIYLLRGTQWETGYTEYEDIFGNTITVDYSGFYEEELFDGNVYIATDAHSKTFKKEMLDVTLSYYDQYGILPSTAYTHAYVVSKNRGTEESLLYYNVFEKYTTNENGAVETKYTYDSVTGDVVAKDYVYEKYDSYLDAYKDLYYTFVGRWPSVLFQKTFSSQVSQYAAYDYLNNNTRSKMSEVYSANSDLSTWDEWAVKRKKAIDNLESKINVLDYAVSTYTNVSSKSEYYSLNQKIKNVNDAKDELNEILELLAANGFDTTTDRVTTLLENANISIANGDALSASKWNWYNTNKVTYNGRSGIFISATCNGHTHWDWHYDITPAATGSCNNYQTLMDSTGTLVIGVSCNGHPYTTHCWNGSTTNWSRVCDNANVNLDTWIYGHCE